MLDIPLMSIDKIPMGPLEFNKFNLERNMEYGCKQYSIVNLPKPSLYQDYQYQINIKHEKENQFSVTLYILRDNQLNMFRQNCQIDKIDNNLNQQQQIQLNKEIINKEYEGINQNPKQLITLKVDEKEDEKCIFKFELQQRKSEEVQKQKVNLNLNTTNESQIISFNMSLFDQTLEFKIHMIFDCLLTQEQKKEIYQEYDNQIQQEQQQKQQEINSMFPKMSHATKKDKSQSIQQQSQSNNNSNVNKNDNQQLSNFNNSSYFNSTELTRQLEQYSQDYEKQQQQQLQQQQQGNGQAPHNLRKRKLTNYTTLGFEDESTSENSTDVNENSPSSKYPNNNSNRKKVQRSRKSSYNAPTIIDTEENNNYLNLVQNQQLQQLSQINTNQLQQQLQQLQLFQNNQDNLLNNNNLIKKSPARSITSLHIHCDDEESFNNVSTCSVSQNSNSNISASKKRGDKKNVVKNFTKAFSKFVTHDDHQEAMKSVLGDQSNENLAKFRQQWKEFFQKPKFNNKLIKELILNKKWHDAFNLFLHTYASEWLLNESQVEDKQSHLEVLSDYIKASEEPENIESIVILKCRN